VLETISPRRPSLERMGELSATIRKVSASMMLTNRYLSWSLTALPSSRDPVSRHPSGNVRRPSSPLCPLRRRNGVCPILDAATKTGLFTVLVRRSRRVIITVQGFIQRPRRYHGCQALAYWCGARVNRVEYFCTLY
jgi:hypothetical protein